MKALTKNLITFLSLVVCLSIVASNASDNDSAEIDMFALFAADSAPLANPAPLITNISDRQSQSLNGKWNIAVDEHESGDKSFFGAAYFQPPTDDTTGMVLREHSFDSRRQLDVPGDWNTQDPTLFRYRGTVWYQRTFEAKKESGQRYFIHFDGVNYFANIYLNGQPIATHKGGYTAFNVDVTKQLKEGSNYLVVRVKATLDDSTIPTLKTSDFFKYGGITRDVNLVQVPETFVRQYHVYLDNLKTGNIKAWVQLDGQQQANQPVTLSIKEAGITAIATTDATGLAQFEFTSDLQLWSPENPKLYDVTASIANNHVTDQIGFRSIETRGKQVYLNGKAIYFRGVSMHDESFLKKGVAYSKSDAKAQLNLIKQLNGNFVRLAHYPHNEHTVRYADQIGLMVWSEIPIVTLIDWSNPETLAIAKTQITDNISRDLNRAAIVMWSVANETMPQTDERLAFLTALANTARKLDKSQRPIAAALIGGASKEFTAITKRLIAEMLRDPTITDPLVISQLTAMANKLFAGDVDAILQTEIEVMLEDKLGSVVDIVGYNEYFGWYYSSFLSKILPVDEATVRVAMFKLMKDIRFRNIYGKPMIISEFGAGAKKGYVSKSGQAKLWSEEYQAKVYAYQTDMLSRNDFVQGMSPWVLKDFRSAMRELNGIQDIYNRKGLISEKGKKKKAFYVLQKFYKTKNTNH